MLLNLKSVALSTLLGLACAPVGAHFSLRRSQAPPGIYLDRFAVPSYPPLARLAGIEGEVHVQYGLDKDCTLVTSKVSGGPVELKDPVLRFVYDGPEFRFSGCDAEPRQVEVIFRFALEGEPTNQWAPTHLSLVEPFTIALSTAPPDLKSLGLTRAHGAREKH